MTEQQILLRQEDTDHARAVRVRDIRAECGSDKAFLRRCSQEFGLTEWQSKGLLERVAVLKVAPDLDDWRYHGGWRGLRSLVTVPTKRERAALLKAARAQGYVVSTVVRRRRAAQEAARHHRT